MNLPNKVVDDIAENVPQGGKILLFGMSGGFDVVASIPLYFTLKDLGYEVELANLSLIEDDIFDKVMDNRLVSKNVRHLVSDVKVPIEHIPEGYISMWLKDGIGIESGVWSFTAQSSPSLVTNLSELINFLGISYIIFCGTGMRSIMCGDEEGCGDMLYSSFSLSTMRTIETPSCICTFGINTFGELRSESYFNAMKNVAELTALKAYYGCSFMTRDFSEFELYKFIIGQPKHEKSQAHELILTALHGGFGLHSNGGFVFPASCQFNFFDTKAVVKRSIVIDQIDGVSDYAQAVYDAHSVINNVNIKLRDQIPA
jgi:hypothetical protein